MKANNIHFLFLISAITIIVTSCSSNGGDSTPTSITDSAPVIKQHKPGIYFGAIDADGGVITPAMALITSDERFAIIPETMEGALGTVSNEIMTGTIYSIIGVVPISASLDSASEDVLSGTYSSLIGNGSFLFTIDAPLYSRGSSLAKLEGIWVNVISTSTWVIQSDGSFITSSISGCDASGQFEIINSANNEYSLSITISNCVFNGTYSGIGALSDEYFTDDHLSFVLGSSSVGTTVSLVKQ